MLRAFGGSLLLGMKLWVVFDMLTCRFCEEPIRSPFHFSPAVPGLPTVGPLVFYKIFDAAVIRTAVLIVDKIVDVWCHSLMILLAVFILSILSRNACLVTIEHSFELLHQVVIHPLL